MMPLPAISEGVVMLNTFHPYSNVLRKEPHMRTMRIAPLAGVMIESAWTLQVVRAQHTGNTSAHENRKA
jgi:hypothetical protein